MHDRKASHGGISLRGAPHWLRPAIWLDGRPRGDVAFLARVGPTLRRRGRVICAAELVPTLPTGAPLMAVPFERPLALGRATLTLTPAGSGPGAACLHVVQDGRRVSIATAYRPRPLYGAAAPALDRCDVLALDAEEAALEPIGDAALDAALQTLIARAGRDGGLLVVDDVAVALHAAVRLADAAALTLPAPVLRAWAAATAVGRVAAPARGTGRPATRITVLGPAAATRRSDALPRLILRSDRTASDEPARGWETLPFGWRARGRELDAAVAEARPREVVCWGAGAPALAARLARSGTPVTELVDGAQLALL
ncbi:MAG: hypothetical protein RIT45_2600 [Pseudomonadota bacterium]